MTVWLWANVLLTIFALAFVRTNSNAPHRYRFFVCFAAMCCWLVPWGLLSQFAPTRTATIEFLPGPQALSSAAQSVAPAASGFAESAITRFSLTTDLLLTTASVLGLLLFARSCYNYRRFLLRLARGSRAGDHLLDGVYAAAKVGHQRVRTNVRIQRNLPGALTTGFFVPTVWIHEDLLTSPDLKAALVHELTHAQNHDNAYLWAITLIQNLFWWNPLVLYLGYQARRLQELSCDEACDKRLSGYRDMLNLLILRLSRSHRTSDNCAQAPGILGSKSFNVHRIRALEKEYIMEKRHYVSTALLLILSFMALGWATAQEEVESQGGSIRPEPYPVFTSVEEAIDSLGIGDNEVRIAELEAGITMEEANEAYRRLGLYAYLLDRQYDAQEAEIIRLNQELSALRTAISADSAAETPPITGPDGDYQLLTQQAPVYPPRPLARGLEGYVVVQYTITTTGQTSDLVVVESTSSLFDRAAIEAVQEYSYRPRIVDGSPVAVTGVRSRVEFELPE